MLSPKLSKLFASTQFRGENAENLWTKISVGPAVFAQALSSIDSKHRATVDKSVDKAAAWLWKLDAGASWPDCYAPIRAFRTDSSRFPRDLPQKQMFLSSGTTSGPEGRSKSGFSEDGLELYRRSSLLAFEQMLLSVTGSRELGGVSLVPPTHQWPDSSLAQMIDWISQAWDVTYADYTNADSVNAAIRSASSGNTRPVFIFGTAFHLIDLLDEHGPFNLPPGSLVIETGGTKGRTRSVTRPELYDLIATGFSTSQSSIVSEYGMCELASQAYDFVPRGSQLSLPQRSFRFPWWAPVAVMSDAEKATNEGQGALVVWDTARLDVGVPLQVEDFVSLRADGSFFLEGRVPLAPLKGCSLKVDEVLTNRDIQHEKPFSPELTPIDWSTAKPRAASALDWIKAVAADPVFYERMARELGSPELARDAIADLRACIPKDSDAMIAAARRAVQNKNSIASQWLIIPPSTHSIAALHPLTILFALGVSARVRLSSVIGEVLAGSAFKRACDLAIQQQLIEEILPSSWRITSTASLREQEHILVFGDHNTIEAMRGFAPDRVIGFGNALATTITDASELADPFTLQHLIHDNTALAQRGCLSARMNLVLGPLHEQGIRELKQAFHDKLTSMPPPSLPEQTARSIEIVRLKQLGAEVYSDTLTRWNMAVIRNPSDIRLFISRLNFCFVFVILEKPEKLSNGLLNLPDLRIAAISEKVALRHKESNYLHNVTSFNQYVPHGTLNRPHFDGTHLGRALLS